MDAKKEIRNLECQLAFREASEEASSKGILGTICGRAICFNAESQVLDEYGQTFREVIAPEAATMEFLNTQDIKINMLHRAGHPLEQGWGQKQADWKAASAKQKSRNARRNASASLPSRTAASSVADYQRELSNHFLFTP